MPPFVLTVLKVLLLLLLYFFVYRAVRTISSDLSEGGRRERRRGREPRPSRRRGGRGEPGRVVMTDPSGAKTTFRLNGTMDVGRDEGCAIRPEDTYISQQHARIAQRGEGWVVEDLHSTNGTYLNQRKVAVPTRIHVGDRIRIGKTVLEVRK